MKPITLTMTAFGPYKDTETVDFRDLKDHRLFVISGKTGAGKTTIFDGICFALYGQASGEDRTDTKALRSQFADDSVQTTVELTFDIHHRRFRVLRQIPYRKQGNKSDTLGRCELHEVKDEQLIPVVDRQIVTEVNEKIEQLLGFSHAQFSQIMMLPQGEFRKFLTSDTGNKEAIMRKIFKTEPYQKIVDRLKMKKDEANADYLREKQVSDAILHQIPAKLPTRDALLFTELASEYPNFHRLIAGLQEEHRYYQAQSVEKHEEYTRLYSIHNDKQKELHSARMINEQFEKLRLRQNELQQVHAQRNEMTLLEQRLRAAERAARLEDLEQQVKSNEVEWKRKEQRYHEAAGLLSDANKQLAAVTVSYEQDQAREQERTAVKEELLHLNTLLPIVSGLNEQQSKLAILQKKVAQFDLQLRQNNQELEQQQAIISTQKKEITELESALEDYELHLDELSTITAISRQMKTYHEMVRKFQRVNIEYEGSKEKVDQLAVAYHELENRWIGSQAVMLAASLQDEDACPVCGSTHHPAKAVAKEEQQITKQQLDKAKQEWITIEQDFHAKQAERQQVKQNLETIKLDLQEQQVELERDYRTEQVELEKKVAMLRKNRDVLKKKRDMYTQAEIAMSERLIAIKDLEQQLNTAKRELETKQAIYDHTISSVPEGLRVLSILQEQIRAKETVSWQLEEAWKQVQQQLQEANTLRTQMDSREQMEKQAVAEIKEKLNQSRAIFTKRMEEEGFATEESYLRVKLSLSNRQEIQQSLQTYVQTLHTLQSSVEEIKQSIEGKQPIDIQAMEQQVVTLKVQYEQAFGLYNQSQAREQSAEELYSQLKTSKARELVLEKTHGKITNLYDIVRGQNKLKISFERFIQIEYLERIIQAANIRLRELSNGQYELIRSDRQETRGKQSGLGIDVYDAYTGQTRDVKTLSGGEKFNASLCLALGMADVIQSFQGAVRMETMFIDEGFGALDEEAIQKAIDTLIALQQSGRMIGIISHIDEMKEAIPATLQVTKLKEGYSKTKFVLN
ncbi:AAA family ATPase [Sporosarcina obsidiansis]|uniref:AAA family ATPase n=1 Tax=Sporosarcina obsidiansis TaxID=2660748 RepID=UPI00129B7C7D|nr:SMC family ATPase [Sporosarcina obsidiansis]